jgi:hypothetical protein
MAGHYYAQASKKAAMLVTVDETGRRKQDDRSFEKCLSTQK